jgi:hypothetical protein
MIVAKIVFNQFRMSPAVKVLKYYGMSFVLHNCKSCFLILAEENETLPFCLSSLCSHYILSLSFHFPLLSE